MADSKLGSLIDNDIQDIIRTENPYKQNRQFSLILHTPYKDIDIKFLKLMETLRNYSKYIGDVIITTFNMLGGDFVYDVYPYRDNLELTIEEIDPTTNSITATNRYKFVLVNNNANVYGSKYSAATQDDLNKTELVKLEGQCIDRVVEGMRLLQVEGIYENSTLKDIMLAELKEKISSLKIDGEEPKVNIDIVEPNNNNIIQQMIIPAGIYALDFPTYLQNTIYGVYNSGIGTYIQRKDNEITLYVYPLYDINRFDQVEEKIMAFFTTSMKFNAIDNTFKKDGDVLKILVGTTLRSLDDAENTFMSEGSGFIRVLPEQMMNRNALVTNDSINLDSTTQLEGTKFKDRKDGAEKPIFVGNESNMYKHRSMINRNSVGTYQFQWHYSNPDDIYPGMPIQYMYEDGNGEITKLEGIVQATFTQYDKAYDTTSTMITFFAKKPIVYNEEPYEE